MSRSKQPTYGDGVDGDDDGGEEEALDQRDVKVTHGAVLGDEVERRANQNEVEDSALGGGKEGPHEQQTGKKSNKSMQNTCKVDLCKFCAQ